jgi:hypothetical protein
MASTGDMNIAFGVTGGDSVSREAKRIEQSLNKLVSKIDHQAKSLAMSAREMDLYKAATLKADSATVGHINALHDSIDAQMRQAKEIQNTIDKSKAEAKQKQLLETQERERADSINSIISSLQREQDELGQSNDEIQIRRAMMQGATDAELNQIHAMQQSIASHKAKLAEQKKNNLATQQAEKAEKSQKQSIDRLIDSLNEQKNTLGMTQQELDEYKAAQMGATQAQIEAIRATHQEIEAKKKSTTAGKGMHNSLQMMRGGFGQVGHQIQDISVQMQMGTNGMIVLGQQGSQIASLFGGGGAIIGAFVAVGAAIYTYLNAASVEAEKKLKELKDELVELSLTAEGLDKGLRAVALVETANKIESLKNQVGELSEELEDSKDRVTALKAYTMFGESLDRLTFGLSALAAEFYFSDQAMKEANQNIKLNAYYTEELNKRKEKQLEIERRLAEGEADPFMKHAESSEKFRKRLKEQQEELGKTADQIMMLNAIRNAGGDKKVEAQNIAMVESFIAARKANEDFNEAMRKYREDQEAQAKATEDANDKIEQQKNKNLEFVKSIQMKADATGKDKYETILASEAYSKLGDEQKELVKISIESWKAADEALKKKTEEERLAEQKIDTIASTIESLTRENEVLKLQTEQKYTAAEAEIYYTLAKAGATAEVIKDTLALQDNIKAQREALDIKPAKTVDPKKSTFGSLDPDVETDMEVMRDIDGVMEGFKSEQELLKEHYGEMHAIVEEGEALNLLTKEEMTNAKKKIDEEYLKASEAASLQAMSSLLGTAQSQMQGMQEVFGESTAIGKAFYVASQAMAAGQAIIGGLTAKMNVIKNATALGMDTGTATALGSTMAVMGYANAGAIMGQTLASFEGGGITFNGVRSGGIDGKGGRMAVVHPNEKITDLEKGGSTGGAVNVSFTINAVDTQGFDQLLQSRRGQIVGMVQKAVNNVGRRIM